MSKEQHIHELIDQYLAGELIGQELDKFKIRLKDDASFLKQVQVQKAIIQSIEANREAELRALLAKNSAPKKRGFVIPFQKRTLSIAAAILVFVAVGFLIKTQFPNGFDNLAENKPSKSKEQKVPEFESEEKIEPTFTDQDSFTHDLDETDENPDAPVIEIAEDNDKKEDIAEPESKTTLNSPTLDLSKLQEDEDVINADDEVYVPKRDSMIGQKSIALYVFAENVAPTTTKAIESAESESDKKKLFERKKNKDAIEKEDNDETVDADYSSENADKFVKSVSGNIRVEFWVSVVNFKGYKFDGQKLLLFDTKPNTLITVSKLNGQAYVSKNGVYYKIIPNNSFNQLTKVTDPEIIKALSAR